MEITDAIAIRADFMRVFEGFKSDVVVGLNKAPLMMNKFLPGYVSSLEKCV